MLLKCYSAALIGIQASLITIEIHAVSGIDFSLVGLPDNAVKESRDRIRAALMVNGYSMPIKQITINMAPADIKKEGASFDLPLAIGILSIAEEVSNELLSHYLLLGELSLDGTLQPVQGVLPIALCAKQQGFRGVILPKANAREAAVVEGIEVIGAETLLDVVRFLNQTQNITPTLVNLEEEFQKNNLYNDADFSDIRGQEMVRYAMEIAAAGGHNILMIGPPGAGKSMLAKRLPTILPPLTMDEALETTKIHSVAGLLGRDQSLITRRPFRSPHHTVTEVALTGGGNNPRPGEISLANNGVLFLDELPEYKRTTLEVLRQPLEDRKITVARSKRSIEYPASFMLVAAMNPCPCGHYGDPQHTCTCTPAQVHRYKDKISGPLLDRIDLHVSVQAVSYNQLKSTTPSENSASVRERVIKARNIQYQRFRQYAREEGREMSVFCNAQMTSKMLRRFCAINEQGDRILADAMNRLGLSARAYDRILKVARTIADLKEEEQIQPLHIIEAISFREFDKDSWGEKF